MPTPQPVAPDPTHLDTPLTGGTTTGGSAGRVRWFSERTAGDAAVDELTPRYRLGALVGSGGAGEVHEAFDLRLRRKVAIKTLRDARPEEDDVRRFLLEAQVAAQLEHPGIAPVYDVGVGPDGTAYFAMRLVQGRPLNKVIADDRGGPLARRLEVFLKVCDAVALAHARGVVHRDLKPSNVVLGDFGEVVVLDWGLAKLLGRSEDRAAGAVSADEDETGEELSRAGVLMGTPSYMSPEQARGEHDAVGPHTDVHALGAVLYALLTGDAPYPRGEEALPLVREGRFPPPSARAPGKVPRELEAIVLRAMRLRPEDRYPSVDALAADVRAFLARRPVSAMRYSTAARLGKWAGRHRKGLAAAAVALVLGLAALLVEGSIYLRDVRRERNRAVAAERNAALRLADGEVALALACIEDRRIEEARRHLAAARRIYDEQGAPALQATVAASYLAWLHPPALLSWHNPSGGGFGEAVLSGDGRLLASDDRGVVRLFEIPRGRLLARRDFGAIARGVRIVLGFRDGRATALLWTAAGCEARDVVDETVVARFPCDPQLGTMDTLSLTRDGRSLLVSSATQGSRLWSLADGSPAGPPIPEACIRWVDDDGTRAVGRPRAEFGAHPLRAPERLELWNLRTGDSLGVLPVVDPLLVSPGGAYLVHRRGGTVAVMDLARGVDLWSFEPDAVTSVEFYDGDARMLLLQKGSLERRDAVDGRLLERQVLPDAFSSLGGFDLDPAGDLVVVWDRQGMRVLDLRGIGQDRTLRVDERQGLNAVDVSPDGLLAATGGWAGRVPIYEPLSGVLLRTFEVADGGTRDVAFSRDGALLLAAGRDGRCRLWHVADGSPAGELAANEGIAMSAAFLPGGRGVFVAYESGALILWDALERRETARFPTTLGNAWDVDLTRDGRTVLVTGRATDDPAIEVFDVATRTWLFGGTGRGSNYRGAFSPDGSRIAVATHDGHVRLWDTTPLFHERPTWTTSETTMGVGFSPDGLLVAAGQFDGAVLLRPVDGGEPLPALRLHERSVEDLEFLPGGDVLVSVGDDGRLAVFDLALGDRWAEASPELGPDDEWDGPRRTLALAHAAALRRDWPAAASFLLEAREQFAVVPHVELARALWAAGRADEARVELRAAREAGEALPATIDLWLSAADPAPTAPAPSGNGA